MNSALDCYDGGTTGAIDSPLFDVLRLLLDMGVVSTSDIDYLICGTAEVGNTRNVCLLLQHGAHVNARNGWPLWRAAMEGHVGVVECLLSYGADTHLQNNRARLVAARKGYTKILSLLNLHKKVVCFYGS